MTPSEFVRALREEVKAHPAVTHPFLKRFAAGELKRWQIWGYASQHYHLVCFFPAYLEAIADRTPDAEVRRLLREILEDEYMRPESFERSHPALYRRFLRALGFGEGDWDRVPLLPATRAFVQIHLDMKLRSWLEALGAVGPGHEWAIPLMFPYLMQGIERRLRLLPQRWNIFSSTSIWMSNTAKYYRKVCSVGPRPRGIRTIFDAAPGAPSRPAPHSGADAGAGEAGLSEGANFRRSALYTVRRPPARGRMSRWLAEHRGKNPNYPR